MKVHRSCFPCLGLEKLRSFFFFLALQLLHGSCQQQLRTGAAAELRLLQQEVASLKQDKLELQEELLQLHRQNAALSSRLLQVAPNWPDEPATGRRVLRETVYFGDPAGATSRPNIGSEETAATSTSSSGLRPEQQEHLRRIPALVQQYGSSSTAEPEQWPDQLGAGFVAEHFETLASYGINLEGARHHLGGYSGTVFWAMILPFCCFLTCSCCLLPAPEDAKGNRLHGWKAVEVRLTNFRPFFSFALLAAFIFFVLEVTGCLSQLEGMVMRKVADLIVVFGALLLLLHMIFDRLRHLEQLVAAKIEEEIRNLEQLFTDVKTKVNHVEEEGTKAAEEAARELLAAAPSSFTTDLFNWHSSHENSPPLGTQVSVPEDAAGRGNYQLLARDESQSRSCFACLRTGHASSARTTSTP